MAEPVVRDHPLAEQIKNIPVTCGVYLMKNAKGVILYVGKATNLRQRVRSYFGPEQGLSLKIQQLVPQIRKIDFFITASEQEALILEQNLIKRHHPPFNVSLKDDKSFPYLKISIREDFPRIQVVRRLEEDGSRYFGPFASARSVRQTLKMLRKLFPYRSCSRKITGTAPRPCLEYHVGNCLTPCTGAISTGEYKNIIKNVILFLEGKQESVLRRLEAEMHQYAEALDFENAALTRDKIAAARDVIEAQQIAVRLRGEQDVIALAGDKDLTCAQVFFIRGGKLTGRESFALRGTHYEEPHRIITSFIEQFYSSSTHIPPLLLTPHPVEHSTVIEEWLTSKRGSRVKVRVPQRGGKKQLMDIVAENARQGLVQLQLKQPSAPDTLETALAEIQQQLGLPGEPSRIEGYDISNIQGTAAVGSMVVFERGKPRPSRYRRFRIRTVSGTDDYAMLQEVLSRRFKRITAPGGDWATRPNLVLIDGGKGQLNAALAAMAAVGAGDIPVSSLAKENEEIFIPGQKRPLVLSRQSPGLQLLQRVRDEAHRFALAYHGKIRRRQTFSSALDDIPGIGTRRKRALLRHFGSLKAIKEASVSDLTAVNGISPALARKITGQISESGG